MLNTTAAGFPTNFAIRSSSSYKILYENLKSYIKQYNQSQRLVSHLMYSSSTAIDRATTSADIIWFEGTEYIIPIC